MAEIGVNVAVLQDQKILLTQREDFETWILPGGGMEPGESVAQAAIRETKEETGLDVQLTRLVGIYSRLGNFFGGNLVLFTARVIGGEIKRQPGETIAVQWFPFDQIPSPLSIGHQRRIEDAISGKAGLCVAQVIQMPGVQENMDKQKLYELRDQSGLPRQEFYLQWIEGAILKEETEVGDFE